MRPHNMVQRAWLPVADALDRAAATATRAALHGVVQATRAVTGRRPVDYVVGPATPHELVHESALARLLRYPAQPASPAGASTAGASPARAPIVIVPSLINRYYVLDLLPELSVIAALQRAGFEVFVLDWKAPGAEGPDRTFADYVDGAIPDAVARASAHDAGASRTRSSNEAGASSARAPSALVLGYCMGGTLAALFAARHPSLVRGLCLLGTPIDFHSSGLLARLTEPGRFDADALMDTFGNMPPALMQSGFKALNPVDAAFKLTHLVLDAADDRAVRHRLAVESWLEDNAAFPGGVYREYIRALYQDNALAGGRFRVGGELVDLRKLRAPLLNVIALRDRICEPPSSRALDELCGTPAAERERLEFDTGHIGLTTSRRAHAELWPRIIRWFESHATPSERAPS